MKEISRNRYLKEKKVLLNGVAWFSGCSIVLNLYSITKWPVSEASKFFIAWKTNWKLFYDVLQICLEQREKALKRCFFNCRKRNSSREKALKRCFFHLRKRNSSKVSLSWVYSRKYIPAKYYFLTVREN